MQVSYRNTFYYLSLLLIGVIIAYWPVSLYVYSLKNDAINYFLPVRRLVVESWQHHLIPFWTPYLDLGYPIHGDMQSGAWNPVVQLFSLFGPYTLYSLHLETLLYVYLCGVGMFFLLRYFKVHPYANMLVSFAFMLCGYNTDSAQFLNWIASLAYLPFVFLFFYRCLHEQTRRMAVYTAFFLYLYFTSAYPADFIILIYVLAAILIWYIATSEAGKKIQLLKKVTSLQFITLFVFLVLSAPALISFYQVVPWIQRGSGVTYEQAMQHSLHPFLLSSYIIPLVTAKMPGVEITNDLMRNSYFGIIPFIFFISAYAWRSQDSFIRFLKYATLIFLLFSFGEWGGVRVITYYIFPLMDSFRHPSNARMFTIFFSSLLAAFAYHELMNGRLEKKIFYRSVIAISVFTGLILLYALITKHSTLISIRGFWNIERTFGTRIKNLLSHLNFSDLVLINVLLQIPFIWLTRKFLQANKWKHIALLSVINSIVMTILLQPQTVVKNETAKNIANLVKRQGVSGYPFPNLQTSIKENSEEGMIFIREIGPLNLYNKKIGRTNFWVTPAALKTQNRFWYDSEPVKTTVMNYPLIYFADSAIADTRATSINGASKYVFVDSSPLADSINQLKASSPAVTLEKFTPNDFTFQINAPDASYAVLLQNYFPAWNVYVDGIPIRPHLVNTTFMGLFVPAGNHTVEFIYSSDIIAIAWWLSLICTLTIIIIASGTFFRSRY
jgi:hypothetical protein